MAGRLEGKVAIVTGAGGGIGRAHAHLLAAEGASVVVNDLGVRKGSDAASTVAQITEAGGVAVADDTSATWDGAAGIVEHALDEFGRIDILVNNATAARSADLWELTEEDWDLAIDVNLKGYFALVRSATPHFARQRSGVIVNTSSASGCGHPSAVAYAAAKEGVIGLTRTVARELGRFGVRCNAIRPFAISPASESFAKTTGRWTELMGLTMTPRRAKRRGDADRPDKGFILNRVTPESHPASKIAPLVVWLCTDAAAEVNGRTFLVAGDAVSLFGEQQPDRTIKEPGGWTLDRLDEVAPTELIEGLTNDFLLEEHPHLQQFDHEGATDAAR
jgi:3-oxoacyl-[acyl-carrier protein] reductase